MSNRIPTEAQTFYADSRSKYADETRVQRNRRRNARQKAARATFGTKPFVEKLKDARERRELARLWGRA